MHLCSVKNDKHTWSIHLRARIPASHAGHRGSNPLSTTNKKLSNLDNFFFLSPTFFRVSHKYNLIRMKSEKADLYVDLCATL